MRASTNAPLLLLSHLGIRSTQLLFVLIIAVTSSLGGCASPFRWLKDGFSAQHAEAKFAACQLEAERLRYVASESDEERETRTRHEAGLCMKADGWRWAQTDGESASDASSSAAGENSASRSGGGADPESTQSMSAAVQRPTAPDADSASEGADAKAAAKPNESSGSDAGGAEEDDDEEDDEEEE